MGQNLTLPSVVPHDLQKKHEENNHPPNHSPQLPSFQDSYESCVRTFTLSNPSWHNFITILKTWELGEYVSGLGFFSTLGVFFLPFVLCLYVSVLMIHVFCFFALWSLGTSFLPSSISQFLSFFVVRLVLPQSAPCALKMTPAVFPPSFPYVKIIFNAGNPIFTGQELVYIIRTVSPFKGVITSTNRK